MTLDGVYWMCFVLIVILVFVFADFGGPNDKFGG
jgi:hypothetical protein